MSAARDKRRFKELQTRLQIRFADPAWLEQALTHRSFLVENDGAVSNERLEFLGDAVLDLVIAQYLFAVHGDWPEGELTKMKAAAVRGRSLEKVAHAWNLGQYVRLSHGEEASGGRSRRSLLSDAVEAVIGAYYLDQGLEVCRDFVLREMAFILEAVERREHERDYKTELQELCQARYQAAPSYTVCGEHGPPHARIFAVEVSFAGDVLGGGEAHSKKEAEQQAAASALQALRARDETP